MKHYELYKNNKLVKSYKTRQGAIKALQMAKMVSFEPMNVIVVYEDNDECYNIAGNCYISEIIKNRKQKMI